MRVYVLRYREEREEEGERDGEPKGLRGPLPGI